MKCIYYLLLIFIVFLDQVLFNECKNQLFEKKLASLPFSNLSVIVVLDLSKPNELWTTQEILIKEVRNAIKISSRSFLFHFSLFSPFYQKGVVIILYSFRLLPIFFLPQYLPNDL